MITKEEQWLSFEKKHANHVASVNQSSSNRFEIFPKLVRSLSRRLNSTRAIRISIVSNLNFAPALRGTLDDRRLAEIEIKAVRSKRYLFQIVTHLLHGQLSDFPRFRSFLPN